MIEWIKVFIGAVITGVGVYISMATDVKDHGRRLDTLDHWAEVHQEKHETQYDKIDGRLSRIEINIARMAGDDRDLSSSVVASPTRK